MTEPQPQPVPRRNMRMRYGVHRALEDVADQMIFESVRGIKKHSDNDILTPWKEKSRRRHEIYVPTGTPEESNRLGVYNRTLNPTLTHLNSREGIARSGAHRVPRSYDYESGYVDMPHTRSGPYGSGTDSLTSFLAAEEDRKRE